MSDSASAGVRARSVRVAAKGGIRMIGSIGSRGASIALLSGTLLLLGGCGDDGAGAGGTGNGATQTGPTASTQGSVSVTVTGAMPLSGIGTVSGSGATSVASPAGPREVRAEGTSNGILHRFAVTYDPLSGVVLGVVHDWGAADSGGTDARTACVRSVSAAGQVACGPSVSVDVAAGRVSFVGTVLRGDGSFASILNGDITFTLR